MTSVADNLERITDAINRAAARAGRDPAGIELMAVTKTHPLSVVEAVLDAGISLIGENRVQEAQKKFHGFAGEYRLHLIGHLQRNKAAAAADLFDCVESIDKIETARALDAKCAGTGKIMDVLIEMNTSEEDSKSGYRSLGDLERDMEAYFAFSNIRLRGLMTIAPFTDDLRRVRAAFASLRDARERISGSFHIDGFEVLSMGMSSDFEIAVEEGATRVRIGSLLLGEREGREVL